MKKLASLAVAAAFVLAGSAWAGPDGTCVKSKDKAACSKSAQTVAGKGCCSKGGASAVASAMASLPQMMYVAGDLTTPCIKTATDKAGCESKLKYQVAGKNFECKKEASAELAGLLEEHARKMMTVQYMVDGKCIECPTTAKTMAAKNGATMFYRLAGVDFDCESKADAAAKAVREAVAKLAADNPQAAEFAQKNETCTKTWSKTAEKKGGCSSTCGKGAATASGKSGCGSKAELVTKGGCGSKASTASARSGCGSKSAATTASGTTGCGSKSAATTASGKSGCGSKSAATTASAKGGCGSKSSATASGKGGCGSKSEATTVAGKAKGGCCADAKAKTVADKGGCCSKKGAPATTAKGDCSKECPNLDAEQRLANMQEVLRVMVETAAGTQLS